MAMIKLNVPTLAQELQMCCWHTSAMMIWQYWQQQSGRQGPMDTLSPVYTDNKGITPAAFVTLAKKVGLSDLPVKTTHDNADLFKYLRDRGPIWCAGFWYGFGHIIVLTGVDGGTVYFNDPDQGVKKTGTIAWFNEKLSNSLAGCLMYKDKARY
ncbi:MAG: papain-like cysteine protease family protein [Steroidobacter sp.]